MPWGPKGFQGVAAELEVLSVGQGLIDLKSPTGSPENMLVLAEEFKEVTASPGGDLISGSFKGGFSIRVPMALDVDRFFKGYDGDRRLFLDPVDEPHMICVHMSHEDPFDV